MNTIFVNSKNSKTSNLHRLNLAEKINLKISDKYIALSNLSLYHTSKNIGKSYKNNKFKILTPTWAEEFELPDGSYSISDIPNYFEKIFKNMEERHVNP